MKMLYTMRYFLFSVFVFCITLSLSAQIQELGTVRWMRSYDEAIAEAEKKNKPILLLFQEVPGCATCRNYGDKVLSHPLLVDAIENEFVPLAIYNNVGGQDRKILEKYGEPSWNNPVVRIIDSSGKNIMERMSGDYTSAGLSSQLCLALKASGRGVPQYLDILQQELSSREMETAYYQMYCFWSGEAHLGAREGVIATEPGWMNGAEVVRVHFDKSQIKKKQLDKYASQAKCKAVPEKKDYKIDKDPQYYLKKSKYSRLALSEIQKTKINAALAAKQDASVFLSPTQKVQLRSVRPDKMLYTLPLEQAWAKMLEE